MWWSLFARPSFLKDETGTIAIMFAFAVIPILISIGVAIDFNRSITVQSNLLNALDAALLAAANPKISPDEIEQRAKAIFEANYRPTHTNAKTVNLDFNIVETVDRREITASAQQSIDLLFGKLLGMDRLVTAANSTVIQKRLPVEIALVLDISSSMRAKSRMKNLKLAADKFIDFMLDLPFADQLVRIAIVPYGGTVNIGQSFKDLLTRSERQRLRRAGRTWNGCIEIDGDDMSGDTFSDGQYLAVPNFWKWNENNKWCPKETSKISGLSKERGILHEQIKELSFSDGTGIDIGASWGMKALIPNWAEKFPDADPINAGNDKYQKIYKVLIVMTDGAITAQFRPEKDEKQAEKDQLYSKNEARENLSNICNDAKTLDDEEMRAGEQEIEIHTIGFEVKKEWMLDELRACSSNNFVHDVEGLKIERAFQKIADAILRKMMVAH